MELVKQDKKLEAVSYARKFLSSCCPSPMHLGSVMTTLAFSKEMLLLKYPESNWLDLETEFKETNYAVHSTSIHASPFASTLQVGFNLLKCDRCKSYVPSTPPAPTTPTPNPTHDLPFSTTVQSNSISNNVLLASSSCPSCDQRLGLLGKDLPTVQHTHSLLICNLSGSVMNESNPPLILPNGRAYSEKALLEMASKNQGKVICPATKQSFFISEAKKAFIL
jgi:macrophage erythroblast attacher